MAAKNIVVVEDESIVSKDIQQSLKKLGYNVVGAAATGEKAIELVDKFEPDLVLMDIMLKGQMSGIDAAGAIKKRHNIPVIYLTAYADENTLSKAKVTEPYGYIIKPFKEVDIHTSIEMALYKHEKNKEVEKERDLLFSIVDGQGAASDIIFVKSKSRQVKLNTSEIYFVEALKDYVVINLLGSRYTIHSTMKDIEKKLNGGDFIRVHRSFIVRLDKIAAIEQSNLFLENEKKSVPIGGSYKIDLQKKLKFV
ncbi:MAG: response regulator [Flavobacteriales bacterium]|jgi:DNA-binding LytR/AlgR family response regulator|nr:response regulator [Flavobacteriales bacterium]